MPPYLECEICDGGFSIREPGSAECAQCARVICPACTTVILGQSHCPYCRPSPRTRKSDEIAERE